MPPITRYTLIDSDNKRHEPDQPIESFILTPQAAIVKWSRDDHHALPVPHHEMLNCEIVITYEGEEGDRETVAGTITQRTTKYGLFGYSIRTEDHT